MQKYAKNTTLRSSSDHAAPPLPTIFLTGASADTMESAQSTSRNPKTQNIDPIRHMIQTTLGKYIDRVIILHVYRPYRHGQYADPMSCVCPYGQLDMPITNAFAHINIDLLHHTCLKIHRIDLSVAYSSISIGFK